MKVKNFKGFAISTLFSILFISIVLVSLSSMAEEMGLRVGPDDSIDTTSAEVVEGQADTLKALPRICINLKKGGRIVIELYPDEAPIAVERVLELVKKGFYDGLRFHRVEDYLIQTGRGDIEIEPIEGEMFGQDLKHEVGMVGMARLPDDYDSATTQFYICKKRLPRLNGEYTLIGKVVEGMELVFKMKKGDKIKSIDIVE